MQENELVELVRKIQSHKSEGQVVEVKRANVDCPGSLYDSLSSFSNQNSGGIIVFGLDEENKFEITGVYDAQDLQHRVSQQCREMEPVIRALFTVADIDGKIVVSAEIPPQDLSKRPVYYRGKGRLGGSFVRVGDADEHMSEFEVYTYESYHRHEKNDRRIIEDADTSLFDANRLSEYIKALKSDCPNFCAISSEDDLLERIGLVKNGKPSLAALMVFSSYPQLVFPQLCITAIVIPCEEKGISMSDGIRFSDNCRISGAIPEMLDSAEQFVLRNIRHSVGMDENGKRVDKTEYPMKAIREAILNALIHRDYSAYTETCPIRIEIYPDRIEISNKGDIYGSMSVSALGSVDIGKRNAFLVDILEKIHKTENRNSGIATMRAECKARNLPEPAFYCIHGEFKVIFRNCQRINRIVFDRSHAEDSILAYCELPRSREDLAKFAGLNQNYVMTTWIRPLIKAGKLLREDTSSLRNPFQRYVSSR